MMKKCIWFLSTVLVGLPGISGIHQEGTAVNEPEVAVHASVQGEQSVRWEWPVSTPEAQGLDSRSLEELVIQI